MRVCVDRDLALFGCLFFFASGVSYSSPSPHVPEEKKQDIRFIQVSAHSKEDRSAIANLGVSIEAVRSDSVWAFATPNALHRLQNSKFKILGEFDATVGRGGHDQLFDFPPADSRFHNYEEAYAVLKSLASKHADWVRLQSLGKSLENRDLWALHINSTPEALVSGTSHKPGVVFMGAHHAREHLSVEVPLMLATHLLTNREDPQMMAWLEGRDIWIIPMVNPDGAEWDIKDGKYKSWRKNRRNNGNGTYGVDLNRNYGFMWGTGGSDTDASSEVYMGKAPFSEPESQRIRDFVDTHLNIKVLLSFHTFSELILYPWGHKYDSVETLRDRSVFEILAQTMAQWNGYKPQQSSDLYIASGDTTDWAYGTHGIFAFTFELSPKSMWNGGFYPGEGLINKVFQDNLKPCLYLLDVADDPYKVIAPTPAGWFKNYVEPAIPYSFLWDPGRVDLSDFKYPE
jgi:carboxypeptidase T